MARHYTQAEIGRELLKYGYHLGDINQGIMAGTQYDTIRWLVSLIASNSELQKDILYQVRDLLMGAERRAKFTKKESDNPSADAFLQWANCGGVIGTRKLVEFPQYGNLSMRTSKAILRAKIVTVADLIAITDDEILGIKNVGVTSLNELREFRRSITNPHQEAPA